MQFETRSDTILISTYKSKLQPCVIHNFLKQSYWSPQISYAKVLKKIKHSLCFGVYKNNEQIGFARVITDYTSFGYLADVFILKEFQGNGYGTLLIKTILSHPKLIDIDQIYLRTEDAHGVYEPFGFKPIVNPENMMCLKSEKNV